MPHIIKLEPFIPATLFKSFNTIIGFNLVIISFLVLHAMMAITVILLLENISFLVMSRRYIIAYVVVLCIVLFRWRGLVQWINDSCIAFWMQVSCRSIRDSRLTSILFLNKMSVVGGYRWGGLMIIHTVVILLVRWLVFLLTMIVCVGVRLIVVWERRTLKVSQTCKKSRVGEKTLIILFVMCGKILIIIGSKVERRLLWLINRVLLISDIFRLLIWCVSFFWFWLWFWWWWLI